MEKSLKECDPDYSIAELYQHESDASGELKLANELLGQIETNIPPDENEIEELLEDLEEINGKNKRKVLDCLKNAKGMVAVKVLFQHLDLEETMQRIDPVWEFFSRIAKGCCRRTVKDTTTQRAWFWRLSEIGVNLV